MMKFLKWLAKMLDGLIGINPPSSPIDPPVDPTEPPSLPPTQPDNNNEYAQTLLTLHNQQRQRNGLRALQIDHRLTAAAQKHSDYQAATNRMGHTGKNGSSVGNRVNAEGYRFSTAGENVAMGYSTPSSVFSGWMNSSGHRANILRNSYKDVGFGMAISNSGRKYWTTVFAADAIFKTSDQPQIFIIESDDLPSVMAESVYP